MKDQQARDDIESARKSIRDSADHLEQIITGVKEELLGKIHSLGLRIQEIEALPMIDQKLNPCCKTCGQKLPKEPTPREG